TEVTTKLGDRQTRSGTRNAAIFPFADGKFTIWTAPKQLYLEYEAETSPHDHFFIRVMEAMSFILGRRLGWNFVEEWRNGSKFLRARGVDQADVRNLPEPLRNSVRDVSENTWRLFADYLRFILPDDGGGLHPVSALLYQVYQARQGTIEAQALALGVAIEGLCKELFPLKPETETRLKGWISSLREHCDGWAGFQDEETYNALYQRLSGLLGTLLEVRTKDTLRTLVSQQAISEAHSKAWGKLRNPAAHAGLNPQSMQKLVDLCAANTVLLYNLIFKAIGYCGTYTDYSEHGHPTKQYGPSATGRPISDLAIQNT
ncbi:MAG: hypothetical protein MUF18_14520, partial [Fimbriiglobus sp.]|nr:hypothetical protein [Fimbriiglobus sp.]